ncbi:glutamate 5-kinase [Anaerolinea sp.]|uniref:glutamate 5-kinase n=1 Tax=Anaerolinea sp. TaxID=1872519 RepID=UPI002ACEC91D|nr:glutamate 5-kinase [Anaerolinea sp.]
MRKGKRIVVKVGTSTLTDGGRRLSPPRMVDLARQIALVRSKGVDIILVSSGAIAAGREVLNYPELPRFIPKKQMLAAVGQPRLMAMYTEYFAIYGQRVAQVLLTRADLMDRKRYLNARDTFEALLLQGILPIVNENDTVATEEIRFGDNDTLSAQVAALVEADDLILLTDQAGLYEADPRVVPDARLIREVPAEEIPDTLWEAAGGSRSGLGTGGMLTKLRAADLARRSGTTVWIAQGNEEDIIIRIVNNEKLGTRFAPMISHLEGRKRYLLAGHQVQAGVWIDKGAARALSRGGSLLPVGIIRVEGEFERGDTIRILNEQGKLIALGLTYYSSSEVQRFAGKHSDQIESILGYTFGEEVVHHNHMVFMRNGEHESA